MHHGNKIFQIQPTNPPKWKKERKKKREKPAGYLTTKVKFPTKHGNIQMESENTKRQSDLSSEYFGFKMTRLLNKYSL